MSHISLFYHIIFRTKYSEPTISELNEQKLYAYISGIIKNKKSILYIIGGKSDHIHILVSIPPNIAISDFMKVLKVFAVSILAMLVMCACDRSEPDQIEMDSFYGAWQEYFGPDYHVEGSRTWYIKEGSISVNTYDWYSDTESERILT